MENVLEISGLKKSYGRIEAVRGIDLEVKRGELFAFLGPNGAGKSTTIEIISTLLEPDAGSVRVCGFELGREDAEIRKSIGIVFQYSVLDNLLTVEENLEIRASFYGLTGKKRKDAIDFAATVAGVTSFIRQPYGKLSGGQRRRADIARALVNTPKLILLDEPTTGLDPQTRLNVWDAIHNLQENNHLTVFLTTHYMEEAAVADNVAIIDHGLIVATGTPAALKSRYSADRLYLVANDYEQMRTLLEERGIAYQFSGGQFVIGIGSSLEALPILEDLKGTYTDFQVIAGDMDDVFVGTTGREMREDATL